MQEKNTYRNKVGNRTMQIGGQVCVVGAEYVARSATGEPYHKNRRKEEGKVSLSLVTNDILG